MKLFKEDIKIFRDKIESGENFTFSKYADGEWAVMKNRELNNNEFLFKSNDDKYKQARQSLIESFQYKNERYYVGISCPCCQGIDTFREMKSFSGQDDSHLTWANLWVNSNYSFFVEQIIPIFSNRKIVLVCNKSGLIERLPFTPIKIFGIDNNAWIESYNTINDIKKYISEHKIEDSTFLFCCGPFGNILAYELTKCCQNNMYLDIGSTLNPWLRSAGFERYYYLGNNVFSRMECIWGQ